MPRIIGALRTERGIAGLLLAVVVLYGALLRFDALTLTYGAVERPAWLREVQQTRSGPSALRPDSFQWERWVGRYISDPYTYLQYAREMRSFYAAHRREPVFPFATKTWLWLLADQDVAVSFASASFSVLAIVATYLVGAAAFSRWVGLCAAAAMAVEYDVITWAAGGWRDDAFTCAVALSAWAMLRVVRAPTTANAVLLGAVAGVACLIRITSVSFLVPGAVAVALAARGDWRTRLRPVILASAAALAVAGPYVFNCWRVFGDPLYAINVHADVYRETGNVDAPRTPTVGAFVVDAVRQRPVATLETALLGMTTYPFENKWSGFYRWSERLARALSWASLVGLFVFAGSTPGRVLLVVLAGSLLPYALTWRLIRDWRFTEHAYPIFLVAAFYVVIHGARLLKPSALAGLRQQRPGWRSVAQWIALSTVVALTAWVVARVLPPRVAREALAGGDTVSIGGSARDSAFFGDGWSNPIVSGNVKARVSRGAYATVHLPLPAVQDYGLTIRMDPFPAPAEPAQPLPTVRVFADDRLIGVVDLHWNPERVGAYDLRLPAAAVRPGNTRLAFAATEKLSGAITHVRLWYVRVRPR